MNFSYSFPAVKGVQANRNYYITMVPLKLLPKIFTTNDESLLPEFRAQRKINEFRIPEIKKYILNNRDNYVFSALSASIDGVFEFVPIHNDIGVLNIDLDSVFLINDGQHRKAAIEAAMSEDRSLLNETISIVIFEDLGLKRSQQMFTDLNKHAVRTSNSLSTLYDSRDEIAVATKDIIASVPFFNRYTDKERDILGKNSSSLFTLYMIYKANQRILHKNACNDSDLLFLKKYWSWIAQNIIEWQEVLEKTMTKKALKENYIVSLGITISALGKLGRYFFDNKALKIDDYKDSFRKIDWLRRNPDWEGRVVLKSGKILSSDEAINLTYIKIKQLIHLPLTPEESVKERSFLENIKNG